MQLSFCPTIGKRLYYIGDADDEHAPMLKFEFCNEFSHLSPERKEEIAKRVLYLALAMMEECLAEDVTPEPSEPLSEASIRLVNSILTADVPEENFLRDTPEEL